MIDVSRVIKYVIKYTNNDKKFHSYEFDRSRYDYFQKKLK
jgi:hypothetical protein